MEALILGNREEVFNGNIKEAILPGADGEVSIWDFHQPCLVMLKEGRMTIKLDNEQRNFMIADGLVKFKGNRLVVICNMKEQFS